MRETVSAGWETVILVCGKCSKRQKGGFGPKGRMPLAKLLRRLLPKGKKRHAPFGVVETRCLGLCPRHAVVAIDARRPGEWQLIRPEMAVEDVAVRLGLNRHLPTGVCRDGDQA